MVGFVGGEVGFREEGFGDGEAGLEVAGGFGGFAVFFQPGGEAEESLGVDGCGGAIDGFVWVVGVCGAGLPVD